MYVVFGDVPERPVIITRDAGGALSLGGDEWEADDDPEAAEAPEPELQSSELTPEEWAEVTGALPGVNLLPTDVAAPFDFTTQQWQHFGRPHKAGRNSQRKQ